MENRFVYTDIDEKIIIQKILDGEKALFEVLIRRTNALLYKIARMYGFNHQDSEDLMQESHISAFQHLNSFAYRSSYKTWISKIMIHKCLYKLKYGYQAKETNEIFNENAQPMHTSLSSSSTDAAVNNNELGKVLESCIQQLPLIYRSVFLLRELEGYSVIETAEMLGITEVNVKVRLNRARIMMQKELETYYNRSEVYSFNLKYCDPLTKKVMEKIDALSE
jgi:RNA polymerase sigma factor, sigma-70 family